MLRKMIGIGTLGCLVALLTVSTAVAQRGAGAALRERVEGAARGERGGLDMEAMRERMEGRQRERFGLSAEEWTVVRPRLRRVQELLRDAEGGGRMAMLGGARQDAGARGQQPTGGRRGGQSEALDRFAEFFGQREPSAVQKAARALQEELEKPSPSTERIKERLTALRKAREDAKQQLATAQAELRKVLSLPQEARCVLAGLLD